MRFWIFLVLDLGAAISVLGADEKLPVLKAGGDIYSNVTITAVSATDIYFTYDLGVANVKLKNLAPNLQEYFKYDPAKAQQAKHKLAADQAQYHHELINQPASQAVVENRAGTSQVPAASPGKKIWAKSFLNQKAPELIVEKWLTSVPDCRGKFVLIDFWATWCPPCRAAIAELNDYHRKFGDKLVVIGISDETEDAVRRLENPKIEYSVAIDTQARTKGIVGVTGIPHVLIIDPQGYVRWEGFPFLEGNELNESVVADILDRYSH